MINFRVLILFAKGYIFVFTLGIMETNYIIIVISSNAVKLINQFFQLAVFTVIIIPGKLVIILML